MADARCSMARRPFIFNRDSNILHSPVVVQELDHVHMAVPRCNIVWRPLGLVGGPDVAFSAVKNLARSRRPAVDAANTGVVPL
jgi:hypothetical protein